MTEKRPRTQYVKSVYFPDADSARQRAQGSKKFGKVVSVAFSASDPSQLQIYAIARSISSATIRRKLKVASYSELLEKAEAAGVSPSILVRRLFESEAVFDVNACPDTHTGKDFRAYRLRKATVDKPARPFLGVAAGIDDSPELIDYALSTYAPESKSLIDPFAGTGNVPLIAGRYGIRSYYCEIEPLFRYLAALKFDIAARSTAARVRFADELFGLCSRYVYMVEEMTARDDLSAEFLAHIGKGNPRKSPKDAPTNDIVAFRKISEHLARARTLADLLLDENMLLGRVLQAAVAIAWGRVERTGELDARALRGHVVDKLGELARLVQEDSYRRSPREARTFVRPALVCENAVDLSSFDSLETDTVLASLPAYSSSEVHEPAVESVFLRLPPRSRPRKTTLMDRFSQTLERTQSFVRGRKTAEAYVKADWENEADLLESVRSQPASAFLVLPRLKMAVDEVRDAAGIPAALELVRYFMNVGNALFEVERHMLSHQPSTMIFEFGSLRARNVEIPMRDLLSDLLSQIGYQLQSSEVLNERLTTRGGTSKLQELTTFSRSGRPARLT
ncbi:MAG: hypothetical protein ABI718_13775 [Acidobacteriota bacterium]